MSRCSSVLIHCMDFRLIRSFMIWLEEQAYLDNCDVLSYPGASKDLLEEFSRDYLLKHIGASVDLHGIEQVILLHHSDCGAYNIKDSVAEKEKQLADMESAAQVIQLNFKVKVVKFYATITDYHGPEVYYELIE